MACKLVLLVLSYSLVLSSARLTLRQADDATSIVYERFHVQSTIVARYAITRITSAVMNSAGESQELSFQVQLPETAFISNFTMIVNGTTYLGIAKEKERAREEFENRQDAGENVGLVESRATNLFSIRINTAANSRSTFVLEYEELLIRRLSKYQQIITLNPGSKVEDFQVGVRVIDEQGIASISGSDYVTIDRVSNQEVMYTYSPSVEDQDDQSFGLARDMVIEYDVNHPSEGAGLIIVNDCYFAQFFSPSGLPALSVDIIFVIDVSGSMAGTKIEQTREALRTIINQLRPIDHFTMVTFESSVDIWENRLVPVSEFRQQGQNFVSSLQASGSTNFDGGLQTGIGILKEHANPQNVQLLVMLTDGEPTAGVTTNDNEIIDRATAALVGTRISLNCLGFGFNLNFLLLQRLAIANRGIAQRIYEDVDAAQQLEGFFEEISSPILHTINVIYPQNFIESISDVNFPLLFDGSEIVVAGKFSDDVCVENAESFSVQVEGTGASSNPVSYQSQVDPSVNTVVDGIQPSTERLVAYLTIQQLLDQKKVEGNETVISSIEEEALALSLRYNFVTELTSLIVVQEAVNMTNNNRTLVDGEGNRDDSRESIGAIPANFPGGGGGDLVFDRGSSSGCGLMLPRAGVVFLFVMITSAFYYSCD